MARQKSTNDIPDQVIDVLKTGNIGYLSTISKSGELYSYPIAYYYSSNNVYFVTPVSAAKYKIIKNNPIVSLIVDNGKVTTQACGAMLQGRAKIFTVGRTILSILSVGPKIAGFSKKYPGMLTFYARGKELPDERKLYKYRLIRISPTKIVYWTGYNFGRHTYKTIVDSEDDLLDLSTDEEGYETASKLFKEPVGGFIRTADHDWLARLEDVSSSGLLTEEERNILTIFKSEKTAEHSEEARPSTVTKEEKQLLMKRKMQVAEKVSD